MCGIAGIINFDGSIALYKDALHKMCQSMSHRGPDDEGYYYGKNVAFGHKRLSIIDLKYGHQPMCNENEDIWIVYNGEIYNYLELRDHLIQKGHIFKTHSDTEVIIHLYEEYSYDCLQYLNGMFAFAVWDDKKQELFIARDRVGIKPLYYHKNNSQFIFASEIKAILKSNLQTPDLNLFMVNEYLSLGYVLSPNTLFNNIFKLEPAHYIIIKQNEFIKKEYWDIDFSNKLDGHSEKSLINKFEYLLYDSAQRHLISEVPVGVFLSGGIDSSTVAAILKSKFDKNIKSFSIVYDAEESEEKYIKLLAKYFNINSYEYRMKGQEFFDLLDKVIYYLDEPLLEAAAVALFALSNFAKKYVTVLVSGEGSDEIFGGYQKYHGMQVVSNMHPAFRYLIAPFLFENLSSAKAYIDRNNKRTEDWYFTLPWQNLYSDSSRVYTEDFLKIVKNSTNIKDRLSIFYSKVKNEDVATKMQYIDFKTYLPDDLLIKADKTTMANSLELRVPFLDYRLVEFAFSLPTKMKIRGKSGKYILKKTMSNFLPKEIIERKKAGFPLPIQRWLKTYPSDLASDILMDKKFLDRQIFERRFVENMLAKYKNGQEHCTRIILTMIFFELWCHCFIDH